MLDGKLAYEYAKRDNLTGLFNDRFLHSALEHAVAVCRKSEQDLSLLFLDLDYFKRVNDTHGHLAGSQVLREVGHLLRRRIPEPEVIVARYGGDEFVVACPESGREEALQLAESLRLELSRTEFCRRPGEIQPTPLHLTGLTWSIGVASLSSRSPRSSTSPRPRACCCARPTPRCTGRRRRVATASPRRPPPPRRAPSSRVR